MQESHVTYVEYVELLTATRECYKHFPDIAAVEAS